MIEIEIKIPGFVTKFFNKFSVREEIEDLKYNLYNYPEDWTVDAQIATMCHGETGITLWITSGWKYLDLWPKKNAFTKREKKYLWKAIKPILKDSSIEKLSDFAKLMDKINKTQGD